MRQHVYSSRTTNLFLRRHNARINADAHGFFKRKAFSACGRNAWCLDRSPHCRVSFDAFRLAGAKVADLFGVSRVNTSKWCHKANAEGLSAVYDKHRSGRPTQFDDRTIKLLDHALNDSPKKFGIERTRWDGKVVAEYLLKKHGITIHVRHAQRLIRKLGFSLRQPIYRYAQATQEGVAEHVRTIKKTSIRAGRDIEKSDTVR